MKKILFFMLMILFSQSAFATKYVALTFDDGPSPKTTPQVLSILKKNNIHATFFVIGKNAVKSPDLLKEMIAQGHQIGNHSYSHPWLTKIPFSDAVKELKATNQIVKEAVGITPTFRRPPGGFWNPQIQKAAGMNLTMWTIDTKDRQHKNPTKTLNNIKANLQNGSIILMHDIHPTSVQALPNVIAYIKSQGYTFVTVEQMAKISPASFKTKNYTLSLNDDSSGSSLELQPYEPQINFSQINLPERFEEMMDFVK